jgi:phosphate transport system ATP-binding protein
MIHDDTHGVTGVSEDTIAAYGGPSRQTVAPETKYSTPLVGDAREATYYVRDLDFWYSDFNALTGVSLDVLPCSVTAFIGPSGCGKSTFLRCMNRMNDLIAGTKVNGTMLLNEADIYGSGVDPVDLRRRVGMIFQQPNPFPQSIYENVAYGPRLQGIKKKSDLDDIVEDSLKRANLWKEVKDILGKNGLAISGGQQQRLCIARVLAVQPEVLLMDEPCSAIDPTSVQKIEDLMAEIKDQVTIVIVTHNMQQAARVSDQTSFFLQEIAGEPAVLVESGKTADIFTAPIDKRTEDYITGRFG